MAKQIRSFVVVMLLLMAASAFGQSMRAIRANVPFSFEAAGRTWPAGDYRVRFDVGTGAMTLTSYGIRPAIVFPISKDETTQGRRYYLRFEGSGDTWILTEASFGDTLQMLKLNKVERELLRTGLTRSRESREIVSGSTPTDHSMLLQSKD
jgi:hypothetical protein